MQGRCSLYSCIVENEVVIGANTVVMDGCRIEEGAVITPNSVIPPGRLIPARQVWGGNPVEYIRDVTDSEQFANYAATFVHYDVAGATMGEYAPWNSSYLKRTSSKEDVDGRSDSLVYNAFKENWDYMKVKRYLH